MNPDLIPLAAACGLTALVLLRCMPRAPRGRHLR
jgi:hypothetical protein